MTATQQLTIKLNNAGVSLIENGNVKSAIRHFAKALHTSKQFLLDNNSEKDVAQSLPTIANLDQCMASSKPAPVLMRSVDHDDHENNNGSQGFLYRRAIYIPECIQSDHHYQSRVLISVMIIFNLALAHQLYAMENGMRVSKLHKASKLYVLAYNLQSKEQLVGNALFTMATVNNLGLVYQQLNETETAGQCFQHLLSTLMFLVDCGEVLQAASELFDGFFRNTSHLIFQHDSAAAAA
jgi:tetratricopeptide (TPR) repeat protein